MCVQESLLFWPFKCISLSKTGERVEYILIKTLRVNKSNKKTHISWIKDAEPSDSAAWIKCPSVQKTFILNDIVCHKSLSKQRGLVVKSQGRTWVSRAARERDAYSISAGWRLQLSPCRALQPERTCVPTRSPFKALNWRSIWNWNVRLKWTCLELECGKRKKKKKTSYCAAASRVDIFLCIVFTDCIQYRGTRDPGWSEKHCVSPQKMLRLFFCGVS